jgi:O-antigen ligase
MTGAALSVMRSTLPGEGLTSTERFALHLCIGSFLFALLFPFAATKYALGAVLGLAFVVISLREFYIALALFTFCVPLEALLPQDSLLGVRGLNVQTAFVLYFTVLSLLHTDEADTKPPLRNIVLVPLCGLIAVVFLSAVRTGLTTGAPLADLFARVKNWWLYSAFVYFSFKHIRTDRQRLFVLVFLAVVSVLVSARSLEGVFSAMGLGLNPLRHRAGSMITPQPNLWGGFLAMCLCFSLSFLIHCRLSAKGRLALGTGIAIMFVNFVYTLSRGAWLAFGFTVVLLVTKSKKLAGPILVLGLCGYLWMPEIAIDRFQSGFEGQYDPRLLTAAKIEGEEAAARIIQWRSFLPLLAQSPLIGSGYDRYPEVYYQGGYEGRQRSAHSTIIEIGVEEGVVGLFFYFWLLFTIYRGASEILRSRTGGLERSLAFGLMSATVCLLFLDVTGTRFRNSNIMVYYWIVTGMTLNMMSKASSDTRVQAPQAMRFVTRGTRPSMQAL